MKSTLIATAVATLLSLAPITASAQEGDVYGGWEEATGYYTVNMADKPMVSSEPQGDEMLPTGPAHNANLQVLTIGGRLHKRMVASTRWHGVRHYTQASLVRGGVRVSSSPKVIGVGYTRARTKWWDTTRRGDVSGSSKWGRI